MTSDFLVRLRHLCGDFHRRPDAGWSYGSLVTPSTPQEPPGLDDGSAAAVLDQAEDIVNAIGAQVMADVAAQAEWDAQPRWKRVFRRKPRD